jgi:AcrR family transcriptional regulator
MSDRSLMAGRTIKTYVAKSSKQREALGSAIRLEILGQFTAPGGMSIGDVAERMGRPARSLYYHFDILEAAGLLLRVGERAGKKRPEALFEPVASRIALSHRAKDIRPVLKAVSAAFRMAERDMEAALTSGTARTTGPDRNFHALRLHARLSKKTLAEINKHLRAIDAIVAREGRRQNIPKDADQHCSLTVALLPLRGRDNT